MTSDGPKRSYTDEEARAIFDLALATQAESSIGHEELVAAAAEVGVSREAVERAIVEMQVAHVEQEAKRAILRRRRRRLKNHAIPFIAINAFFFLVNWFTTPGAWWFLFPLCAWGLVLFFHAWLALSSETSPRALRRELKRSDREQRQSLGRLLEEQGRANGRVRRESVQKNAKLLGAAVEEGVSGLLAQLADRLRRGQTAATGMRVDTRGAPPEQAGLRREDGTDEASDRSQTAPNPTRSRS
jgi:hypothetical protein